jgi:hypothetical protein
MKRSERRELRRILRRRILAGERKADIVGWAAVDGLDWQTYARMASQIPTPASRRRWRWLNRALLVAVAACAAGQVAAAVVVAGDWLWLGTLILLTILLVATVPDVVRFRLDGFSWPSIPGSFVLLLWLYYVAYRGTPAAPPALIAVEASLAALLVGISLLEVHLLLPATQWWEGRPKVDAAGILIFEE